MPSILLYDPYVWKIKIKAGEVTIYCNGELFDPNEDKEIFLFGYNPRLGDKKEYIKLVEDKEAS